MYGAKLTCLVLALLVVSCMPSCCSAPSLPAVGSISINTGLILLLHICMQTHEKQNCVLNWLVCCNYFDVRVIGKSAGLQLMHSSCSACIPPIKKKKKSQWKKTFPAFSFSESRTALLIKLRIRSSHTSLRTSSMRPWSVTLSSAKRRRL